MFAKYNNHQLRGKIMKNQKNQKGKPNQQTTERHSDPQAQPGQGNQQGRNNQGFNNKSDRKA